MIEMPKDHYLKKKDPWRILIIDDSRLQRQVIRDTLLKLNMSITEACDGLEGLEFFSNNKFDLVLVDIVMPNLDGFGFLERFKDLVKDEFVPVILMTGSDDLNSKIKGLSIGADDFLVKPFNDKELVARVISLLRLKSAHSELYYKNLLIKSELEYAKRLQRFIIPTDFTDIEYPCISGKYLPTEDIGGDIFDYYKLDDNKVGFLIADVTGHGIPAALVMSMSKMIFSVYSNMYQSSSKLLLRVNSEIIEVLLDDQYITAFYLIYDPQTSQLRYANAGHCRPLLFRNHTDNVTALDTDGFFLGIDEETKYQEKAIKIDRGDRLFLYTDGISEIKNSHNEEFGEKRLASFLKKNKEMKGDDFCDSLLTEVDKFSSLDERNDDIAFLNIEF
ncbi:MAG: fused response regulator/phosphatase [Spirochaetota bacterium]|nr:fused response regulator/phosphatase [Spirochaetota bacterium]